MITCPICGGEAWVKGVEGDCGATYRRRKCVDCGHSIYTEETETKEAQTIYHELHGEYRRNYLKNYRQKRAKKCDIQESCAHLVT